MITRPLSSRYVIKETGGATSVWIIAVAIEGNAPQIASPCFQVCVWNFAIPECAFEACEGFTYVGVFFCLMPLVAPFPRDLFSSSVGYVPVSTEYILHL